MTVETLDAEAQFTAEPGALITRDGQIEWAGTLLGSGTPYRWLELTGWEDTPGLDSGSVLRPDRHGAWPGRQLAQERVITWSARISAPSPAEFGGLVTALRRATALLDDGQERALVIRAKGGETLLTWATLTSRIVPNDRQAGIGRGTATIQWTASDPRRYAPAEQTVSIPQPTAGAGLIYPLTYPLDYGTASETGVRTVEVGGDTPTSPVVTFYGPCTGPRLTVVETGRSIGFDVPLVAGETLVVDTANGSVELDGADRFNTLTAASVPIEDLTLIPGIQTLTFRASTYGGGASCDITWRDATL
ncbi:phage distal tail protein [Actinomadura rubrisoli]|uniref:Phage tail protein n=1 Tax=Actinomadura rubrisoli TaxID=2530368 RepID=A0A4R5BZ83_9ACTN|nr:phage tail domain-containing protein [Actinomadura rubrisoli]TDD90770.1 phage tail protein [Actinomadura rubrisoli]